MADAASDLVRFIAEAIVTDKDAVEVREDGDVLELDVAADDRGRVIGRQGRVAKAIRSVLAASREGGDRRLEIVD